MISIAICDDDIIFVGDIERKIMQYFTRTKEVVKISQFYSGRGFVNSLDSESFDIVFLDIMLGQECGINVGLELRSHTNTTVMEIVYISSIEKYTRELIQTRPTEYLHKPVKFAELKRVLDDCLVRIKKRDDFVLISTNRDQFKVFTADIRYIESQGRKCVIHLANGETSCYIKLVDMIEQIGDVDFMQIHKSYAVNFRYVTHYNYSQVILDSGKCLTISQAYRKEVRSTYMDLYMR